VAGVGQERHSLDALACVLERHRGAQYDGGSFDLDPVKAFCIEEVLMADLTEEQRKSYWRYNVTLTTILLIIWFVVTYLVSGLWAGWFNQFSFLGFPLGYYMAAQGALAIYVIEIAVYAYLMNKLDRKYGIREEA
jgi:putative solute:sodium symporter small subunit